MISVADIMSEHDEKSGAPDGNAIAFLLVLV
jgi:hypothetical protein